MALLAFSLEKLSSWGLASFGALMSMGSLIASCISSSSASSNSSSSSSHVWASTRFIVPLRRPTFRGGGVPSTSLSRSPSGRVSLHGQERPVKSSKSEGEIEDRRSNLLRDSRLSRALVALSLKAPDALGPSSSPIESNEILCKLKEHLLSFLVGSPKPRLPPLEKRLFLAPCSPGWSRGVPAVVVEAPTVDDEGRHRGGSRRKGDEEEETGDEQLAKEALESRAWPGCDQSLA
mmetsp:Transcript_12589/g.27742  ORF Transcript_12589/g.27742 Transcript_12589/m.27742 type:complete len:234 (-) Transcript_12589:107-808(-)